MHERQPTSHWGLVSGTFVSASMHGASLHSRLVSLPCMNLQAAHAHALEHELLPILPFSTEAHSASCCACVHADASHTHRLIGGHGLMEQYVPYVTCGASCVHPLLYAVKQTTAAGPFGDAVSSN